MDVIWKDVVGYEGIYQVSTDGKIKKNKVTYKRKTDGALITLPSIIMKTRVLRGYETVGLTKNGKQKTKPVHRIIAEAFIPNPENKEEVNHLDGDKLNNKLSNLEWVTKSENSLHAFKLGLRKTTDGGTSRKVAQICPHTNDVLATYPSLRNLDKNTTYLRKEVSIACRKHKLYRGYYWKFI